MANFDKGERERHKRGGVASVDRGRRAREVVTHVVVFEMGSEDASAELAHI